MTLLVVGLATTAVFALLPQGGGLTQRVDSPESDLERHLNEVLASSIGPCSWKASTAVSRECGFTAATSTICPVPPNLHRR